MKKFFKLEDNPLLEWVIFKIILKLWDGTEQGIKKGDKVIHNWMARVCLSVLYSREPRTVIFVSSGSKKLQLKSSSGSVYWADVFWLKKYNGPEKT